MAKIVLSFDDGRRDNYRIAKNVLEPLGIPATFNITTGYINRNIADEDKPGPHEPMTLNELKDLASNELFEIAGHGITHDNDISNLVNGVLELREMCGSDSNIVGIASPHSQFELKQLEAAKRLFTNNDIKYLRISNDYSKMGKMKIWIRRVNRLLHSRVLYYWVNKESIMTKFDFLLYSVPVIRDNRLKEVESLINRISNFNEDCICILMFHSILKKKDTHYSDLFSWDYDDFVSLCGSIKKLQNSNKIELSTTKDLLIV